MYEELLRFPNRFLKNYFQPEKSLMLNKSDLNRYIGNRNRLYKEYKRRAIFIFRSFRKHPIFSNKQFQKKFILRIPYILGSIIAANKLLKKLPISCIILGTTNCIQGRALALAALNKGIPSICMQHGIIAAEHGYLPKISPVMAVYGKYEADWYKNKGVAESNIETIGHPRFDDILIRKPITRTKFQKKLRLNPKLKSVLFIIRSNQIAIPGIIIKHLLKKQKVNVILKIKKGDRFVVPLKKKFPSIRIVDQELHLYDLLHHSDVIVSYPSTVALEAMLAGKPVFIWKSKVLCTTDCYDDMGKFLLGNPLELVEMLVNYLKNEKNIKSQVERARKRFISNHYPDSSLSSGARLKKLVFSLIPKPKILILSNPETIPDVPNDIHLHAKIRYWSEDGSILDILRKIDITPDIILLCGNSEGYAFAPNITDLNLTTIPKGYYMDNNLSSITQSIYFGDQPIDLLFTSDNKNFSLFPQSKIHLLAKSGEQCLHQIVSFVRKYVKLPLPPFFKRTKRSRRVTKTFKRKRTRKVFRTIQKKSKKAIYTKRNRTKNVLKTIPRKTKRR